ncbi:MAG: LysE family transporter, partial [Alphaproteobacteria bacterium]|nr:LysE family transporter [Alphaproteobacteria bacterium]
MVSLNAAVGIDYIYLAASGIVIGIMLAFPIGPVNIICIRRTLSFGTVNGFVSGLGAAFGDLIFAIISGFGLTAVSQTLHGLSIPLELAGGALLLFFGWRTFFTNPHLKDVDNKLVSRPNGRSSLAGAMASTFALTITNPATLVGSASFIAGVGALAGVRQVSFVSTGILVLGVCAGSAIWWLSLTTLVG